MKTVGIIGGLGPEATADLYLRIICIFQQDYGAVYDNDFPEIIIINLPVPDPVENPIRKEEIKGMLLGAIQKLENCGVDFIAIPCNTAMTYLLEENISLPMVSIVEETKQEIAKRELKKIGLLGTKTTIGSKIYEQQNRELIAPSSEQQEKTTNVIMNVLAGRKRSEDITFLESAIEDLKKRGAQQVILGCTELPLLIKDRDDLLDTTEILARAIVKKSVDHRLRRKCTEV